MKIDNNVILKKLFDRQKNRVDPLVRDFLRTDGTIQRKPKKPSKHLGIEVECYGPNDSVQLQKMLFMTGLDAYVQVGYDGSIRSPSGQKGYELRILVTEHSLGRVMKKMKIFFKEAKLKTNDSCGLHVHLDMRHRQVKNCYNKLLKFQDVLLQPGSEGPLV